MPELFVNGPIQNGTFSIDATPSKLVGIRLAAIHNDLLGTTPAPHLWNLVRYKGDLEFAKVSADNANLGREAYERKKIAERYADAVTLSLPERAPQIVTDIDKRVADTTYEIIESALSSGMMSIETSTVCVCLACGYDTRSETACTECGSEDTGTEKRPLLRSHRDEKSPIITPDDVYGSFKTKYIDDVARHVPNPLALSKKRQLGIPLAPIGLNDQVLDPRAGLHVTALTAAAQHPSDITSVVMMMTAGDAIISVPYGRPFRSYGQVVLKYGLHGRIPYGDMHNDDPVLNSQELEEQFRHWYLPLMSLTSREAITLEQSRALRKCFGRLVCGITQSTESQVIAAEHVRAGSLNWVTDRSLIGAVRPRVHAPARQ